MNRILYSCFFVLIFFFPKNNLAQTFWTESFGAGCTQSNVASTGVPTPTNGAWTITNIATGTGNGAQANEWFVSATENGNAIGACGTGCGANRTLHIGSNIVPFLIDPGAAYLIGPGSNTNKRAESPTINCTGQTGISLNFKYLANGNPGTDFCEVLFSSNNGAAWTVLGNLAPSTAGCLPQGTWTTTTFALPAAVNNNATVKVGFRWQNGTIGAGTDPSVAIDDVILFKPLATLTVTTNSNVCSGQNIAATLTGTTAGTTAFTWSTIPGGATITGTTALGTTGNINYPSAGVYTVVVVGFVGAAPTYSAIQSVTVTGTPTVAVTPASQTICAGGTATLTANATAGATLQWATGTFPLITLLGTASTEVVSPGANTSYSVVAGVGSCTAFATTNVVIGTGLTITGAATPTAGCSGSPITLSATGATSYTWIAPPSTTLATGASSSTIVNPTVATTYTVIGDNAGCTGTTTIPVGISSGLSLTLASSSATTCPGQPVTLTAGGAINYTWSPSSTLSSANGATVIATPSVATTYSVIGDNGAGCTGTANITVSMGGGAAVSVIATSTAVCAGFNSTLTAVGASNYTWTGTGFGAPINQPSVSVGPGVYQYTASSGVGCIIVGAITVGTLAPLTINVTQSSFTTCMASNYPQYTHPVFLTPSGAGTYVWSVYVPSTMSGSLGPIFVRPPVSTCYTVTGNTSVCSGSAVVCVTVIPQFTMSIVPPQPIMCLGDSLKLHVATIGTLAVLPISNYIWYDPQPPSIDNPFNPTVTIYPTSTTTYSVEIFDSRACVSLPRLVTVTVLPQPITAVSIPTINGLPTNTICFVGNQTGPEINLILNSTNLNPPLPGVVPTYTWIPPYQTPINPILTPSVLNGSPGSVVVSVQQFTSNPWIPQVQTYTVISGYNGIPGCRRVDTVSVLAVDCRSVTIASVHFTTATANDTMCSRECVTFLNLSDTASGGVQTYTWTFQGGTPFTSNLKNPTICYNLPGVFWVRLKVCNPYAKPGGSCATIAKNAFIKVVDIPNTVISPIYKNNALFGLSVADTTIRFGQSVTMNASGAKWYTWEPDYKISSLISPTVTVSPLKTEQYRVIGCNSKRCCANDTVNVIVIEDCGEMYVPTAFSPNGDGTNDVLYVRGVCLESLNFMVFNRWGEKVFETTDIKKGWDGTYKGEEMNTGVFVYRLEGKTYDGKGYSSKGNVTLVR
jgi:gliding motility-associated-like protein